ncbi:MAG: hypothetical protein ACE5HL_12735 [Terriglobia bacterium]
MLLAYMDESGTESGPVCVVAGFVGDEQRWETFDDDWKQARGKRKSLRMNNMRWKNPSTKKLLASLGPIPHKHGLNCISAVVSRADHKELVKPRIKDRFAKPWMLAFHLAFTKTMQWLPKNETIKFIFEEQREYRPYVDFIHRALFVFQKRDPRVVSIDFVRKGVTPCTEPADYLAYMVRETKSNPDSEKALMGQSILKNDCIGGE